MNEYKYLGTIIDHKLKFSAHIQETYKKGIQRHQCLRVLNKLKVDVKFLQLFYTSIIESVISFGICCWHGNITQKDKNKLDKIIKYAKKMGIVNHYSQMLYEKSITVFARKVWRDSSHPLNYHFDLLKSGKRLRIPNIKTSRFRQSIIPASISYLNQIN